MSAYCKAIELIEKVRKVAHNVAYGVEAEKTLQSYLEEFRRYINSSCSSVGRAVESKYRDRRFVSCLVDEIFVCVLNLYSIIIFAREVNEWSYFTKISKSIISKCSLKFVFNCICF